MKIFKKIVNFFQPDRKKKKSRGENSVTKLFKKTKESQDETFMESRLKKKKIKLGQANSKLTTEGVAKGALKDKSHLDEFLSILESEGIGVDQYRNVPLVDTGLVIRGQSDQFIQMAKRLLIGQKMELLRNILMAQRCEELSQELNDLIPSARIDLHILEHVPEKDQEKIFRVVKTTRYQALSQVFGRPITLVFIDPRDIKSGAEEVPLKGKGAEGDPSRMIVPKRPYLEEESLRLD